MKKKGQVMIGILIFLAVLIVGTILGWMSMGNSFLQYSFFAPKIVAVQQQVFANSQSYVMGKSQDIDSFMSDYSKADDAGKARIAQFALHEISGLEIKKLPQYQQEWIAQIRGY